LQSYQLIDAVYAFAQIKDEKTTRNYLEQLATIATNPEIENIRKSDVLKPFHSKKWWPDLDKSLSRRIESLIQHHKNLTVFSHHKKMIYAAIRINANGDTVANTKIHMIPNGTGWGSPTASSQSEVVYVYESTAQDSIEHIQELRDIVEDFRNNEFFKTEIAPFPLVHFPINNETMLKARSKIIIMRNWGTYSPTMTEQKYFYIGTENRDYNFERNVACHKFEAYGHNSKHGISYLEYYFHPQYGFTEMNYLTYDNDRIEFQIITIEKR